LFQENQAIHWNELERLDLLTKIDAVHCAVYLPEERVDRQHLAVFRHAKGLYGYKSQNHEPPPALFLPLGPIGMSSHEASGHEKG
jgi:hypothetical protein